MLLESLHADGFGYWLAGLIDGEGSFTITPNRPGFICRLSLALRADDLQVLRLIAERTGVGKVTQHRRVLDTTKRKPQALWRVQTKADCAIVVSILDRFPLLAKKANDFVIWREAVELMAAMQPVHHNYWQRRALDWERIAVLKQRLSETREYRDVVDDLQHAQVAGRPASGDRARSRALHC